MPAVRESQLAAADGTPIFVVDWPVDHAVGSAARGIVIMHGLGEHCGRYTHIARFFNDAGFSVRTYDHRGHGRSGGARGDVPNDEAILRDAKLVFDKFAQQFDVPPLLMGHSMGGLFAARFATACMSPLSGLILSSPALAIQMSATQKFLLKVLGRIAPALAVPNGLQTRYLSHVRAVVEAYEKDPLVHPKITPRLLRSMLAAIDFAHAHTSSLAIPTLMVVAGDDRMVDAAGAEHFHAKLRAGIGTLHRYDDYYHEVFNEAGASRVFDDVRNWLAKQG